MKKRVLILYIGYIWTKMLVGLTFYPYKYVHITIRRPVFVPVIFSPLVGIFILFTAAKIGSLFIGISGFQRDIVALFLSTTLISILFWQLLLLYLLGSYLFSERRKL